MTEKGISETVSEKRKRGRPHTWSKQQIEYHTTSFPEVQTIRGKQNVIYRQLAMGVLGPDPRFAWLCDLSKMEQGEAHSWKPSRSSLSLAASWMRKIWKAVALRVCEEKPRNVKHAIAWIRHARTGKGLEGSGLDLANEIILHVNDYLHRHPQTSWTDEKAALRTALKQVEVKE